MKNESYFFYSFGTIKDKKAFITVNELIDYKL